MLSQGRQWALGPGLGWLCCSRMQPAPSFWGGAPRLSSERLVH